MLKIIPKISRSFVEGSVVKIGQRARGRGGRPLVSARAARTSLAHLARSFIPNSISIALQPSWVEKNSFNRDRSLATATLVPHLSLVCSPPLLADLHGLLHSRELLLMTVLLARIYITLPSICC